MADSESIKAGFCHCGCGRSTRIAPRTAPERGWIVGQPQPYALGHNRNVGRSIVQRRKDTETRRQCKCGCGQFAPLRTTTGKPCDYAQSHTSKIHRRSYVRTRVDDGWPNEHQVIAAHALGRPLPPGVQVHHVDENKRNNANRNLVICENQIYHKLLHHRAKVLRAGGNPNTDSVCCTCKAVKPLTAFNRFAANTSTGRQSECRACQSVRFKAWYAKREKKASRAA